MIFSSTEYGQKSANHKVRKLLGRAYLRENRIGEALEVFLGILKDYPDEADVLVVLGNLYRLSGSPAAAERLYSRVLAANPDSPLVGNQALAAQEQANCEWETGDPLSEEAITCLVNRLQGSPDPEQEEKIKASAEILDQVAFDEKSEEADGNDHQMLPGQTTLPAGQQGPLTEDVQQLLPALIEQNIRQARAAGFIELAESLQSLQISLARQVEDHWADDLLREEPPHDTNLDE